ncbi:MAG: DNA N-6-adenine-methyltransferase [Pseudomonadota bacterium]
MQTDIVLQKLDTARKALAEAKTIQETKRILDVAAAAEILAKRQKLGEEAVQYATAIKVEALAQLGRMLKETPLHKGGRPSKTDTKSVSVFPKLEEFGIDAKTSKLAQDIAALPEEKFEAVKSGLIALSNIKNAHVAYNTGENEWYTPPEYIKSAVFVMGRIDLDPASSEIANKTVGASMFFTKEDNGLDKFWAGKVWMNPPYSSNLIGLFVEKYVEHVRNGDISEGIVLVNNATETQWFYDLQSVSNAIAFPTGRIRFLDVHGNPGAPLQGQAILYYGRNVEKFIKHFGEFGWTAIIHKEE